MTAVQRNTLPTGRVSTLILVLLFAGCSSQNQINPNLSASMPPKILWAWERPEDLRFLDPKEFGVAFLAQTIFLEKDAVNPKPRRQPLEVSPGTYIIAVTRIETAKNGNDRPSFSSEMVGKIVTLVKSTLDLPDVNAIQIDFDAVVSERTFYRKLMVELRQTLGSETARSARTPLTMTSLASWCTGDAWFNDFPVDEAVPMLFQMGADEEKIKTYLRNGNDWNEPLCRGSYGLSVNENFDAPLIGGRRMYFFNNDAWKNRDFQRIE